MQFAIRACESWEMGFAHQLQVIYKLYHTYILLVSPWSMVRTSTMNVVLNLKYKTEDARVRCNEDLQFLHTDRRTCHVQGASNVQQAVSFLLLLFHMIKSTLLFKSINWHWQVSSWDVTWQWWSDFKKTRGLSHSLLSNSKQSRDRNWKQIKWPPSCC
jgi:hypothetical protein